MDGFDSYGAASTIPESEADPAAEFLAREQEELAGLEDDIQPVAVPPTVGLSNGNGTSDIPTSDFGFNNDEEDARRSPSPSPSQTREEPEKIRRWREEQQLRLKKKDEDEEKKKTEMREAARKELDEWYKNHDEQVVKTRNSNRSAEKELIADTEPMSPGTEWERIAKLCDFNPKASKHTKDISRMRSIILQVKQAPPVKPNNH